MGLDIGKVDIEYLPRPTGIAYEFAKELACEASCVGDGNAFGFYLREEMEERATEFAEDKEVSDKELMDWIATLPWDEDNYVTLTFNW